VGTRSAGGWSVEVEGPRGVRGGAVGGLNSDVLAPQRRSPDDVGDPGDEHDRLGRLSHALLTIGSFGGLRWLEAVDAGRAGVGRDSTADTLRRTCCAEIGANYDASSAPASRYSG